FLCIAVASLGGSPVIAQAIPDISSIKVDDLSDDQLQEVVRRASSSGLSEVELLQMAKVRGMPDAELEKLRKRLEELDVQGAGASRRREPSQREPRRQTDFDGITQGHFTFREDIRWKADAYTISRMNLF